MKTFDKVTEMLSANLGKVNNQKASQIVVTMLDILILLVPYLPPTKAKDLFKMCMRKALLSDKENAVQKRGYKVLSKLLENSAFDIDVESVLRTMSELSDDVVVAARKVTIISSH